MSFRFLVISIHDGGEAEAELNAFLNAHKVLSVDRRWVEQGSQSFWSFCIDYLPGKSSSTSLGRPRHDAERIDYKEKLPPAQFEIFAKLRELRKEIAQAEAVPVYTIFTNEQLAAMVTAHVTTRAALDKVEGIGEARVAKYGPRFLELLSKLLGPKHEANGPPV